MSSSASLSELFMSMLNLTINPLTVCILLIGLTSVFFRYKRTYSHWQSKRIKGPKATFPFGNHSQVKNESHLSVYKRWIDEYGKLFGVYDVLQPKLIVSDPNLVKKILVENFSSLMNRRKEFFDHPIEKKYSFVQEGEEWKRTRSVFTAALSPGKFKVIYDQMVICSDKLVQHVDDLVSSGENTNVDPVVLFKNFASDSISRSVFSASFIDNYREPDAILESLLSYWLGTSYWRTTISLIAPEWLKKVMHFSVYNMSGLTYAWSLFASIVKHRRNLIESGKQVPNDILKQMMESSRRVNWKEDYIIANLVVIYTAGAHSSNITLAHTCYFIAKYPRVYESIVKEYEDVTASGEQLTLETVSHEFKYLDAVISEVLRLLAPSTYNERRVSSPTYTFEYKGQQITLSKDDIIYFPTFLIHRDPQYWTRGDEFDETRFAPDNKSNIHAYAYLPFGHGARNCIGSRFALTQMKLAILKLVTKYTFSLVDGAFDLLADFSDTEDEIITTKRFQLIIRPVSRD